MSFCHFKLATHICLFDCVAKQVEIKMKVQDLYDYMDTFDFKATDLMMEHQNIGNRRMKDFNTTSIKQLTAVCRIACQSANDKLSFGRLVISLNGHPLVSKEITNCNSKFNNGIMQLGGFLTNSIIIDSISSSGGAGSGTKITKSRVLRLNLSCKFSRTLPFCNAFFTA